MINKNVRYAYYNFFEHRNKQHLNLSWVAWQVTARDDNKTESIAEFIESVLCERIEWR